MPEEIETRLRALARRAGLAGVPPSAVAAALVVCGLLVVVAAWRWWPRQTSAAPSTPLVGEQAAGGEGSLPGTDPSAGAASAAESAAAGSSVTASATVYVHVVGAVRHPGMYALAGGARVADAVAAAGGLSGNAAQAGVNLARAIADGEQVVVPTLDEFARGAVPAAGIARAGSPSAQGGAAGSSAGPPVNINTADAAALDTLPGIGPSTAAKILTDRDANGPFTSAEDLGRVAGIGPKKLEELKPRVCVR